MRKIVSLLAVAAAFSSLPMVASAQDHNDGPPPSDASQGPAICNGEGPNVPLVGADAGHDYFEHCHYRYTGPQPQPPMAREQNGFRDGHIERAPRTPYWSGVRQVYPYYGYYGRCGCGSNWYGRGSYGGYYGRGRHRHYYDGERYLSDELDTQDYGRFSYSYSTRRYTDNHLGGGWRW